MTDKRQINIGVIILFTSMLFCNPLIAKEIKISSPDSNYQMQVYDRDGKIYYSLEYKNQPVILESSLGISSYQTGRAIESGGTSDNKSMDDWYDGLQIDSVAEKSVDIAWVPPYGERSLYYDLYKGYTIIVRKTDNPGRQLQIIVRIYNEGVAFRYHFPESEYLHITQEFTQFTLPEGTQAYFAPHAQASYELLPLKNWRGESEHPLVLELKEIVNKRLFVLLTEVEMTNYARTKFISDKAKPNTIIGSMYGAVDDIAPFSTPWRVIMASEKPGKLIENNFLLLNLNPSLMKQKGIYDATHNVTLPFTRFTQGAADYTACYLKTTCAHQLAMTVVYYSPLQYMYWHDRLSESRDEPELEFFNRVPTIWDDTKVVHGEIGQYITIARRKRNEWFVGTMTNNDARKLKIPLDFLPEGQKYTAKIFYDNPNEKTRTKVGVKTMTVTNKTVLDCDLQASGGQAIWIEPQANNIRQKAFVHPGILFSEKDFKRMRRFISNTSSIAYGSYQLLKENPFSQSDYAMSGPFEVISRDGEFRYTKNKMENDFHATYQNALMWALTKDEKHAQKSLEILSAYAGKLHTIPETNDAPLLAGLEGFKIICAMEILKHTYPNAKMQKIEAMFRNIFLPVLENFYRRPPYTNGNWGPIVTKTYMAAGIYFDDCEMYEKAKNFYYYGNDNGTITNYIDSETGQLQESGRDQAHAQLGIGAMAVVCEMAWKQGDDLYSALNNRLLKGYEYTAKYNLGNDDVPFKQWKDVTGKYNNWTIISDKARGQLRPIYEIAYNHYVNRKKLKMPFTKQVLLKIRPENFNGDQPPAFGSLLFNDKNMENNEK